MNSKKINTMFLALLLGGGIALSACNTGTEPGEVNVERGGVKEVEEQQVQSNMDTSQNYEEHYDHADHENHGDNKPGSAVGDGAYNQDSVRQKRGEVQTQKKQQ